MSQPTNERDRQLARDIARVEWETSGELQKAVEDAIAQARTEGAEAMRQAAVQLCKQRIQRALAAAENPGEVGKLALAAVGAIEGVMEAIARLPTTEGDTTTTERGEKSGALLADIRKGLEEISRYHGTPHSSDRDDFVAVINKARILLARLPKGKETPTP